MQKDIQVGDRVRGRRLFRYTPEGGAELIHEEGVVVTAGYGHREYVVRWDHEPDRVEWAHRSYLHRLHCIHCGLPRLDHLGKKCLFEPTNYEEA